MRSNLWPPTDASSLEPARARIPAGTFDSHQGKQRPVQIAGIQTLRRSGPGFPVGSPCSQAFHSARLLLFSHGQDLKVSGATLLDAAGNPSQIRCGKTSFVTARFRPHLRGHTQVAQSAGGTGLLPCRRERASNISFKSSCRMGSHLSPLSRCIGWKAKTLVGLIEPRSAYRGLSTRFL